MFNSEIKEMVTGLDQVCQALAEHPTLLSNAAKCSAKLRDCLLAEGFTREEAIRIVEANGVLKSK